MTQYGGTTVEVLNTDAEGRLILADAIVRACEDEPDYLIETSTLTGAPDHRAGRPDSRVMGSDEFRDRVAALSQQIGENGWPMPLPDELADDLKSGWPTWPTSVASVSPGCWWPGSTCASSSPRACSGRISTSPGRPTTPPRRGLYPLLGGTGVPVRTLFAALEDIAANG